MAVILQNDQICRYIHTPSSFARQNLLYIQETGRLKSRDRHISRRSHLESYLFFIVLSGRGTVTIGKNLWEIGPGDHIFLDCQEPYAHESSEDDPWTLLWVHFYGTAMSGYHAYFTRHQKASVFHPDSPSDFQSILEQILILEKNRAGNRELLENELLHRLVTQILTWQTEIPVKKEDNITSKLLEIRGFLDEHFTEKISLDELANLFYISKYHMMRQFRAQTGYTIHGYLTGKRLMFARAMIAAGTPVLQASEESGFGDYSAFLRAYRKQFGQSPRASCQKDFSGKNGKDT